MSELAGSWASQLAGDLSERASWRASSGRPESLYIKSTEHTLLPALVFPEKSLGLPSQPAIQPASWLSIEPASQLVSKLFIQLYLSVKKSDQIACCVIA